MFRQGPHSYVISNICTNLLLICSVRLLFTDPPKRYVLVLIVRRLLFFEKQRLHSLQEIWCHMILHKYNFRHCRISLGVLKCPEFYCLAIIYLQCRKHLNTLRCNKITPHQSGLLLTLYDQSIARQKSINFAKKKRPKMRLVSKLMIFHSTERNMPEIFFAIPIYPSITVKRSLAPVTTFRNECILRTTHPICSAHAQET